MLYSTNTFMFEDARHWSRFTSDCWLYIGGIKSLEFCLWDTLGFWKEDFFHLRPILHYLQDLRSLRTIRFHFAGYLKNDETKIQDLLKPLESHLQSRAFRTEFVLPIGFKLEMNDWETAINELGIEQDVSVSMALETECDAFSWNADDSDNEDQGVQFFRSSFSDPPWR